MADLKNPRGRKAPALIRLLFSLAVLAFFVYVYLSPSITVNGLLALLVKTQFSAALYGAGIAGIAAIILVITLIFGRFYCSVLCPLGTVQELFWRIGKFFRKLLPHLSAGRLFRKGYSSPPKIRYIIPLLAALGVVFAFTPLMIIFDPISTFGRGMNAARSFLSLILAIPLALILLVALVRGRAFCAWCPVGITLGLFSSAAPFGMKVSSKCVSCGLCEKNCPSGCINAKEKRIDSERCILCFSCTAVCPTGSAAYTARSRETVSGESRRVFLKGAGKLSFLCGAAYLLGPSIKLFSRSASPVNAADASLPILPPGAKSVRHFVSRCIGCQACVSSCPVKVIKIKNTPYPAMDYASLDLANAREACQYNCVECGQVCPTGAITRLSVDEKHRTRIALSTLYFERCIVNTKHESCGACAEVCPTGALTMTAFSEPGIPFLTRPIYDERYCIGCGACFATCPALPKAFTLAAVPEQSRTVGSRPLEETGDELNVETTDDFPF
ncbi:ferredoxin [Spirochaetia bacterium]|nr:ferredoxin [Spirochaetia bacterium]